MDHLNRHYLAMILAQTPHVGDAHFQDVVKTCCGL
jgi:hypothetical protein